MNIATQELESLFVDELALLQPSAGSMRVVGDQILHVWQHVRVEARERSLEANRRTKTLTDKLDHLDEALLFTKSIDQSTYDRQRDKLREELTLANIDRHAEATEEMDVEGLVAFAERILPRAADLWVQSSLDHKQRLQSLFSPEGIAFDGSRFNPTAVTAPLFSYLAEKNPASEDLVSPEGIEPSTNRLRVCCSAS